MSNSYEDSVQSNGSWQNPYVYNARYAMIICGGGKNAAGAATDGDHPAFWNDAKEMYDKLVYGYNYHPQNLYFLYSRWRTDSPDHTYETDRNWRKITDYKCTLDDIIYVFKEISGKITKNDLFFFVEICHGPGVGLGDFTGKAFSVYNEGDQTKSSTMFFAPAPTLTTFTNLSECLSWITCSRMVIVLQSCYSGGGVTPLSGTNRIVMSASRVNEKTYTEVGSNSEHWAFLHEGKMDALILPDIINPGFTPSLGCISGAQSIFSAFSKGYEAATYNFGMAFGVLVEEGRSWPQKSDNMDTLGGSTYL